MPRCLLTHPRPTDPLEGEEACGTAMGGVEEGRLSREAGSRLDTTSNFRFLKSNHPHPSPAQEVSGQASSVMCKPAFLGHTWVFTPS